MEEKTIIQSSYSHVSKWLPILLSIIGVILAICGFDSGDFGCGGLEYLLMFGGGIGLVIAAVIILLYIGNCQIVVTNVRVYGKAAFGKRVDLPVDSISAVGTCYFNGVTVSSSSGRMAFLGLTNSTEIHKEISQLLIDRQSKKSPTIETKEPTVNQTIIEQTSADELKKYK